MTHQGILLAFVILAIIIFFFLLNGGFRGALDQLRSVFKDPHVGELIAAGFLLIVFVVIAAGITRDGLTVKDILFLS